MTSRSEPARFGWILRDCVLAWFSNLSLHGRSVECASISTAGLPHNCDAHCFSEVQHVNCDPRGRRQQLQGIYLIPRRRLRLDMHSHQQIGLSCSSWCLASTFSPFNPGSVLLFTSNCGSWFRPQTSSPKTPIFCNVFCNAYIAILMGLRPLIVNSSIDQSISQLISLAVIIEASCCWSRRPSPMIYATNAHRFCCRVVQSIMSTHPHRPGCSCTQWPSTQTDVPRPSSNHPAPPCSALPFTSLRSQRGCPAPPPRRELS